MVGFVTWWRRSGDRRSARKPGRRRVLRLGYLDDWASCEHRRDREAAGLRAGGASRSAAAKIFNLNSDSRTGQGPQRAGASSVLVGQRVGR
jgi:hypothetical protein